MRNTHHSIPTTYRGQRFRSRLEARYAAFFDALRWPYEYEAMDLCGYIPDFVLTGPLLVEVKPYLLPFGEDALRTCAKIERAWDGDALLVGANHLITEDESTDPEIHLDESGMFPVRTEKRTELFNGGTIEIGRYRRATYANNAPWVPAYLAATDDRWIITQEPDHLDATLFGQARWQWADAGAKTQWRGDAVQ